MACRGGTPPLHAGPGLAFAKGLSLEPPQGGRSLQLQARWRKVMTEVGSVHLAVENRQGQCLPGLSGVSWGWTLKGPKGHLGSGEKGEGTPSERRAPWWREDLKKHKDCFGRAKILQGPASCHQ